MGSKARARKKARQEREWDAKMARAEFRARDPQRWIVSDHRGKCHTHSKRKGARMTAAEKKLLAAWDNQSGAGWVLGGPDLNARGVHGCISPVDGSTEFHYAGTEWEPDPDYIAPGSQRRVRDERVRIEKRETRISHPDARARKLGLSYTDRVQHMGLESE